MNWPQHQMIMEIPSTFDKTYVQEMECGASGDGIKLEWVHVGEMDVVEEVGFFEGILVLENQEPTQVWKSDFPARLIIGSYGGTRIAILAFNSPKGEAYAAIAYFDDDNAVSEEIVFHIFKSIRFE